MIAFLAKMVLLNILLIHEITIKKIKIKNNKALTYN